MTSESRSDGDEAFAQVADRYGLVRGSTQHRLPPRPSHKRAASEDSPSVYRTRRQQAPVPVKPVDEAESIIRQIINERSFNRALCVVEEPASEEESQSDESPGAEMADLRRQRELVEWTQATREQELANRRKHVKLQVLRLLDGGGTPSTDCDTEKNIPQGKQLGKVIRRRPASVSVPRLTNQKRILSALEQYDQAALQAAAKAETEDNLVLVFTSAAKAVIEGVYSLSPGGEVLSRLAGSLPEVLRREHLQFYYRYDEDDQEFVLLTDTRLNGNVDAVLLARRR